LRRPPGRIDNQTRAKEGLAVSEDDAPSTILPVDRARAGLPSPSGTGRSRSLAQKGLESAAIDEPTRAEGFAKAVPKRNALMAPH
jgi:hypothetical protein